ncbi:MAG: tyrosine-type recombinase/integrase [Acidithiobacillus sp.]|nr:tyrosine-type recombinase/integrase [Acidithiobacillus sp.]
MFPELDQFLLSCRRRRLAENTIVNYQYLFHRFTAANSLTDIQSITVAHIETYLDAYQHLASATIYKQLSLLRTMFNWLDDRALIHSNPFRYYELPRFTRSLRESIPLADLERLLAYIPGDPLRRQCYLYSGYRDNLIWNFCALAGMRISEVLALRVGDLRENGIYIRHAKANRSRVVPMLPRMAAAVDRYQPYLHYQLARAPREDDYLFPGDAGPLATPYIWARFKRALDMLDLRRYTFHNLRHTYATLLLREGVNLPTMQKLLGHASLTSTQLYLHVQDDEVTQAALKHPLASSSDAHGV